MGFVSGFLFFCSCLLVILKVTVPRYLHLLVYRFHSIESQGCGLSMSFSFVLGGGLSSTVSLFMHLELFLILSYLELQNENSLKTQRRRRLFFVYFEADPFQSELLMT